MVFKCPLDKLMQKVRCQERMNVCSRKGMGKRLTQNHIKSLKSIKQSGATHYYITSNTIIVPYSTGVKILNEELTLLTAAWKCTWLVKFIGCGLATSTMLKTIIMQLHLLTKDTSFEQFLPATLARDNLRCKVLKRKLLAGNAHLGTSPLLALS
jgi:hypothetical protein